MKRLWHGFGARLTSCVLAFSIIESGCTPSQRTSGTGSDQSQSSEFATTWSGRQRGNTEISALRASIGDDPAKQLTYVTDALSFEPYAGALRGPLGTIWATAGNSTDKSLLLAALRNATDANAKTRFAWCTLPNDDAARLVDGWLAKGLSSPVTVPTPGASIKPDPQAAADISDGIASWRDLVNATNKQAQEIAQLLPATSRPPADSRSALVAATTTHVWLQMQQGDNWVDLDPTVGIVGKQLCAPQQTAAQLPEGWYHHIGINVRVETRDHNSLGSQYALKSGWRASDIVGSTITFAFNEPFEIA